MYTREMIVNAQNQTRTPEEYKRKADAIIARMAQVLFRAQRKLDDKKYREILKKLQIQNV